MKKVVLVDAITLAGLYTIRILAGGMASQTVVSFWLLAFSVFLFLSLAWVKRYAELEVAQREEKKTLAGRGYDVADLPVVLAFGVASSFVAVLIFALYLDSETIRVSYSAPMVAWLAIPILLYIIGRVWLKSHRGQMHDDPILFVLKDLASLCAGFLIVIILTIAHIGVKL